jgi:hypothetical protein
VTNRIGQEILLSQVRAYFSFRSYVSAMLSTALVALTLGVTTEPSALMAERSSAAV